MIRNYLFDLDGTLFLGSVPIPGAVEKVRALQEGKDVYFLTNAATRSRESVAQKLRGIGIAADKANVYCSSYLVARYIAERHPGKSAFVVGEDGLSEELAEAGVEVSENAGIVVAGLDRKLTYDKLSQAHRLLCNGAVFIATNKDHAFPVPDGTLPGAGALVALLETSSGRQAHSVGKPDPYMFTLAAKEHGLKAEETMMVGDRLDTDIGFAKRAGMKSALVLTGVAKRGDRLEGIEPDLIVDSVASLP